MAFTPISGRIAQIRIGSYVLYGKKWTVDPKTAGGDVTTFEDGGYGKQVGLIVEADIDIADTDYNYSTGGSIYSSPPNIFPTQIIAVTLYVFGIGGPNWAFPNALVLSASNSAAVRETVKWPSIKLYGNGQYGVAAAPWTPPTQ